jgi:small subunit ribosomal protein S16
MSLKIRLAKTGKKNAPTYKVVVAQTRSKRNGKYLAILGDYNPGATVKPVIDKLKLAEWVAKGALLTDSVKHMVEGTYSYHKYSPKADAADAKEPTA